MRFELSTMTMFEFSLVPAQLLIGNSSDLTNSIVVAQLVPDVKSYCRKTFAFALLVATQSMLYAYTHVFSIIFYLLIYI